MNRGTVYLVGAGCGAADLITVRGLALLRTCDVVVYDDLIAGELLGAVPPDAEKLCVGKRSGRHSVTQAEICDLLIRKAREGKVVVRLKGGDPFVFGRGGEEMEALLSAGIPCEEVPGISSAIAVPGEAGIPVTHRGISQSVHVITAHTADTADGLPSDLDRLARLRGTLVFLMGLGQLPALTGRLMAAGMAPYTPAAVVSGGNAPHPATVRGTLLNLAEKVRDVQAPAVIVVGEVAALELKSSVPKPLRGITVGLTGTDAVTEKLSRLLRAQGAETFLAERALIAERAISLAELCDGPRWLIFTSVNGVRAFFRRCKEQKLDLRRFHACRFAVIGKVTAAALEEYGIQADLCPKIATSAALAQALLERVPAGAEICLLRSARGDRGLPQTLSTKYLVREIPLYDLYPDPTVLQLAKPRLETMDYLAFSSASGVERYFEAHGAVPEGVICVCIGDVTAAVLRQKYEKSFLVATDISARGVVDAILRNET